MKIPVFDLRLIFSLGAGLFLLGVPVFGKDSAVTTGQKLYEQWCVRCHGYNAKGSLEAAQNLKLDPMKLDLTGESVIRESRKSLETLIAGGHGRMPGQKDKLSLKQIRAILQYLQTLQRTYASK